jgi:hypothetical protein
VRATEPHFFSPHDSALWAQPVESRPAPDSARARRRTFCRIHLGDSSIARTIAGAGRWRGCYCKRRATRVATGPPPGVGGASLAALRAKRRLSRRSFRSRWPYLLNASHSSTQAAGSLPPLFQARPRAGPRP